MKLPWNEDGQVISMRDGTLFVELNRSRFPLVSRKAFDRRGHRIADLHACLLALSAEKTALELEHSALQEKLELSQASERAERLKRLRAEGLCQWKDDRIRGALQLLYREESGVKKAG